MFSPNNKAAQYSGRHHARPHRRLHRIAQSSEHFYKRPRSALLHKHAVQSGFTFREFHGCRDCPEHIVDLDSDGREIGGSPSIKLVHQAIATSSITDFILEESAQRVTEGTLNKMSKKAVEWWYEVRRMWGVRSWREELGDAGIPSIRSAQKRYFPQSSSDISAIGPIGWSDSFGFTMYHCRELAVIGFEPFDPGWNFQILGDRVEDSPCMGSVLFADVTSKLRNIGGRTSPSANKYLGSLRTSLKDPSASEDDIANEKWLRAVPMGEKDVLGLLRAQISRGVAASERWPVAYKDPEPVEEKASGIPYPNRVIGLTAFLVVHNRSPSTEKSDLACTGEDLEHSENMDPSRMTFWRGFSLEVVGQAPPRPSIPATVQEFNPTGAPIDAK
ncbi:hypothetical protein FA13DRAFT_1718174 [Coprinellus micaceus]|uniref:Uncharacterized protein n=1 Tax=Coprinellus micaceus TaxID=71717 RepID=A0A4Y7SED9_COPMI|nr:hypothetical protein FA13DRAFT_1718174 [Coprinellus micaceus]